MNQTAIFFFLSHGFTPGLSVWYWVYLQFLYSLKGCYAQSVAVKIMTAIAIHDILLLL